MVATGGIHAAEKALLDTMGIPMGACRKPFKTLADHDKRILLEAYQQNCYSADE